MTAKQKYKKALRMWHNASSLHESDIQKIIDLLTEAYLYHEWNSLKEKKPIKEMVYAVCNDNHYLDFAYWFKDTQSFEERNGTEILDDVTHWAYIMEPPKGDE